MPYRAPTVEVTQVQQTVSPTLLSETLVPVIIGLGQYSVDLDEYTYTTPVTSGSSQNYTLQWPTTEVTGEIDNDSAYAYLVQISGDTVGSGIMVSAQYDAAVISVTNGIATIDLSGLPVALQTVYTNCRVQFGFRVNRYDIEDFLTLESENDVRNRISGNDPDVFNKLAWACSNGLQNANASIHAYGINISGSTEATPAVWASAADDLELREVYGMTPLINNATIIASYVTHANSMSLPLNKKERIVFGCPKITWADDDDTLGTFDDSTKAGTARVLAVNAFNYQERRAFWVFPDTVYIYQDVPTALLSRSYIEANLHADLTEYSLFAKFAATYTGTSGRRYYQYDDITNTAYEDVRREHETIQVYVPCPGYYMGSATACMIERYGPEQPFTNLPITGFSFLQFSQDYFSEAQLNVIAGGGNYVMKQANRAAPISSRHQLSTNMTSIEVRELSITKALDYGAKFIRNALDPYIGRYNITPSFLRLMGTTANGVGIFLIREGVFNDFSIDSLVQDTVNPDTLLLDFRVLVKYPVNYILVSLIF